MASESGPGQWIKLKNPKGMESPTKEGESPVGVENVYDKKELNQYGFHYQGIGIK